MLEVDKSADTHSTNGKLEFMMSMEQKEWLMAIVSGDEKKMMNMLNANPDLVNWQNYIDGNSALHFAAKFGNCALIRMLVGNHQADVNIRNNVSPFSATTMLMSSCGWPVFLVLYTLPFS
ncbi:hypothetical protein PHET_10483 [Paragonimus heterotremus]|uniref:Uncharacterized protein n=1 Tax=Paragonimus heterotremus TaxID=100268 RepID=A0A8J4WSJ5_9TREM|nr:hypothetical protein PHET_10483 [Paragonimus heterotremus]